jgi:hypothetical protein
MNEIIKIDNQNIHTAQVDFAGLPRAVVVQRNSKVATSSEFSTLHTSNALSKVFPFSGVFLKSTAPGFYSRPDSVGQILAIEYKDNGRFESKDVGVWKGKPAELDEWIGEANRILGSRAHKPEAYARRAALATSTPT